MIYLATHRVSNYFNPLPPHGGRRAMDMIFRCCIKISIHSLRMEGDIISYRDNIADPNFNPLPPHGGRRHGDRTPCTWRHFNPLPPHGGRRGLGRRGCIQPAISIHSLRMEGDHLLTAQCCRNPEHFNQLPPHGGRPHRSRYLTMPERFQSTPSAWRETKKTL